MRSVMKNLVAVCVLLGASSPVVADLTLRADAKSLALSEGLAIDGVSQWARRPINIDGVVAAMVDGVLGDPAKNPKAGDTLPMPAALLKEGGPTTAAWKEAKGEVKGEGMQASGVFGEMGRGTYVLFAVHSERERVMMLEASGHGVAYVNGEPRVGDPYSFGYVRLPILLHEGANQIILQHANRGEMKARLEEPKGEVEFNTKDVTAADVVVDAEGKAVSVGGLAVPIINTTTRPLDVRVTCKRSGAKSGPALFDIRLPALSVCKVPIRGISTDFTGVAAGKPMALTVVAVKQNFDGDQPARAPQWEDEVSVDVVSAAAPRRATYRSRIDGSLQYVSIVPPTDDEGDTARNRPVYLPDPSRKANRPGLVLSLHGASVEATNQAASYTAKKGLVIACPTNRRPFGFDWEDWGRIDALEAMDFVAKEFKTDPARQYLTGHSMGGHGTWQLGCLYPERFAAIAPSAGWLSFATYMSAVGQKFGPAGEDPVMQKFREVISPSDTISLLPRLRGEEGKPKGIYILHGDADDNVPVSEARRAREELTKLGIPFEFHEQPGAGHWWDDDSVKKANTGPDGQTKWGAVCVDWPPMFEMFAKYSLPEKPDAAAQPTSPLGPDHFHPGSFKRVFNSNFVLVYGTHGTLQENAWAYAKARFDGEQWWYRGNGCARLMSDDDFNEIAAHLREGGMYQWGRSSQDYAGNFIFYGNERCNIAWSELGLTSGERMAIRSIEQSAGESPAGHAWLVTKSVQQPLRPSFAAIGGSTLRAMRTTDRLSYFSAGVDYPSFTLLSPDIWTRGEPGVIAAGFAGADGQVDEKTIEWRPEER